VSGKETGGEIGGETGGETIYTETLRHGGARRD